MRVLYSVMAIIFILSAFTTSAQAAQKKIFINTASRLMTLYDGDVKVTVYHLGLGKVSTPTPSGYFKITEKAVNPSWIDPKDPEYEIPSGPDNPLGYRWMQIWGNYGIHGTNKPESIGGYVSNGCIRMLEADVEKLFDTVEVGTPVEITYNRVVVEKTADDDVVYYIYPDGYGIQNVNVADVKKWIEPFGVLAFESDYDISQKIEASDGEPTFIGRPYNVEVNGELTQPTDTNNTRFFAKAVLKDGIAYMPVVPIAKILRLKLEWNKGESTLKSKFGKVICYERKDQIYCNADDAMILFNMEGGLQTGNDGVKLFRFKSLPTVEPTPIEPTKPDKKRKDKESNKDKPPAEKADKVDKTKPTADKTDKVDKTKPTADKADKVDKTKPTADKADKVDETKPTTDKADKVDETKPEEVEGA